LDDHALFRESLARLLATEPDFEIAGHCSSIDQALNLLEKTPIDVVLLDFDLGTERAPKFLERVCGLKLPIRILVVTAGMTPADAAHVLDQGANGIFLKHGGPALLSGAVRAVQRGETWIDQRCLRELAHAAANPEPNAGRRNFTDREVQVLRGVFEGHSNKEIGASLAISESSVKAAIQQLFQKTGVRTRSQLVRVALERFAGEWQ
jgi:DNA-binding NarL/FixJ family response regulator